jgi:4-amino-4-deoxy-L-arabinose transferase-like glycosyltransferase
MKSKLFAVGGDPRSQNGALFGLLVILAAFLAMQLSSFTTRWVDDESWYLMPIPSIQTEGKFRIPAIPGQDTFWAQTPLLPYLEAALDQVSTLTVSSARGIPLLFGVLLIVGVFLTARRVFSPGAGLLAAAFVAADNLVFLASRTIRPEILVACFAVWAVYAIVVALQTDSKANLRWIVLSAIFSGLAAWSHPNGLVVPPLVLVLVLFWDGFKGRSLQIGILYGIVAGILVATMFLWMAYFDWANDMSNFKSLWLKRYGRTGEQVASTGFSALSLIQGELSGRYKDFLQFPYRVHIALVSVIILITLLFERVNRIRSFGVIVLCVLAFFIFVNNSNPSVRYLTIAIPFLCIGGAGLASKWLSKETQIQLPVKVAAAMIVLTLGLSSVFGNAFYLWKFRNADYEKVSAQLKQVLPADARVYGGMFLWFGMRDRTVIPYIRMPWKRALTEWKPTAVVMDDWVMKGGGDNGSWTALSKELDEYLAIHGTLVKTIDAGFYGNLRVFTLKN